MATDITKRLGYGGSAEIDGAQVLISGGGFEEGISPTYITAYNIDPAVSQRSRMLHADGVVGYAGNISFDVTQAALGFLTASKLLKRRYSFAIGINDGENAYRMTDCYVASLSMSGSPGGLIQASLAVSAAGKEAAGSVVNNNILHDATQQPYGYWYSGNTDVRDWNFSMSQDVQPVYSNELSGSDPQEPRYMKVGLVTYNLQVTTYDAVQPHSSIQVATASFTLSGVTSAEGYTFNGLTDLGMYTHTFESAASATVGSQDPSIIT